jgi:hypothetical protein
LQSWFLARVDDIMPISALVARLQEKDEAEAVQVGVVK